MWFVRGWWRGIVYVDPYPEDLYGRLGETWLAWHYKSRGHLFHLRLACTTTLAT